MLLDSNIVIYALRLAPEFDPVREFVGRHAPMVSAISRLEVLGFPGIADQPRRSLEAFFASAIVLPVSPDVLDNAIALRQQRRMTLGDAIIAATALVHGRPLATHNTRDFRWIAGLELVDPLTPATT
jgi:hypothetical protein